ncbi:hypothetical protein BGZ80_001314 [Entomortierella chlamydospora]|uniref:FAD/NAD(P)-binding domain-containing protein n=1 Tax=Entomortierella chlamydospora TaxID=101097 RepID=A0A9P6SXT6_9FUNG|nr:hypothetical protein BGZ80_001314 [Entomortierella chlamydospora]
MSQDVPEAKVRPEVLIMGAGIAGLTLAILLEQINIPYQIFERATEVKPLGYENLVFSRPRFHEILLKRVPEHKIGFNKNALRIEEKEEKVHVHCSDNTSYAGDILVGADGAYSKVRQSMYGLMDEKGILPKADLENFKVNYTTIVGVATLSNPEKYPKLKEEYSNFNQVIYGDGANCYVITLPDNQISWGFGVQLSESPLKEMYSKNSEWTPEIKDTTLERYRDFPCPVGGTMGELFDATPRHLISKVFIEEKMFKTCYNSRSILIGDGVSDILFTYFTYPSTQQFHPSGGQGAQHAIQDAISLANCLYSMKDNSLESISSTFGEYYKQRYDRNVAKFNRSTHAAKILNGQVNMEKTSMIEWPSVPKTSKDLTDLPCI